MKGWVYVISNKAMDGLVKVGHSTKDPELRAKELNNTGSPHPYIVEYELLIEEPYQVEQAVHKILSNVREGKEWFRCTSEQAVVAIRQVAGNKQITETFKLADRIKAEELQHHDEELRREKEAQEEQNKKMEALFREKEQQIMNKYNDIIRDNRGSFFWIRYGHYFLSLLYIVLLLIIFSKPSKLYGAVMLLIIIASIVIDTLIREKSSDKYELLIQQRDKELKYLKNSSYLHSSTNYIPEKKFSEEIIDDTYIKKHYPQTEITTLESKKCPNCGLFNPKNAQVCDCGFIFN